MSGRRTSRGMVATKSKNKVLSCSTPDHTLDSPSRDSDSMCDSETASPVPFLCTQDGTEGVTDVVWNYYGSNSRNSLPKNSTPVSRKTRKPHRLKLREKEIQPVIPKRRITRLSQKKTQLPSELLELNQYVDKLMEKKIVKNNHITERRPSGSEDDIFCDALDCSPKSILRTKKCLRKNVLSSKFTKTESENALESDDSINECLFKASQAVEENIFNEAPAKRPCLESNRSPSVNKLNEDSMDAAIKSIRSPYFNKFRAESPGIKNDSFDNLVGNLNDSALERLSQMPVTRASSSRKNNSIKASDTSWKLEELVLHESPSRFSFARHSSMPESPSVSAHNKPSSTVGLGKYNSMPFNDSVKDTGDSPIHCTPLEIQKKHQLAREKLLAKRQLPFTQTQQISHSLPSQSNINPKPGNQPKVKFQPKVPSSAVSGTKVDIVTKSEKPNPFEKKVPTGTISGPKAPANKVFGAVPGPKKTEFYTKPEQAHKQNNVPAKMDIQSLIERKRQEALMKLRSKRLQK